MRGNIELDLCILGFAGAGIGVLTVEATKSLISQGLSLPRIGQSSSFADVSSYKDGDLAGVPYTLRPGSEQVIAEIKATPTSFPTPSAVQEEDSIDPTNFDKPFTTKAEAVDRVKNNPNIRLAAIMDFGIDPDQINVDQITCFDQYIVCNPEAKEGDYTEMASMIPGANRFEYRPVKLVIGPAGPGEYALTDLTARFKQGDHEMDVRGPCSNPKRKSVPATPTSGPSPLPTVTPVEQIPPLVVILPENRPVVMQQQQQQQQQETPKPVPPVATTTPTPSEQRATMAPQPPVATTTPTPSEQRATMAPQPPVQRTPTGINIPKDNPQPVAPERRDPPAVPNAPSSNKPKDNPQPVAPERRDPPAVPNAPSSNKPKDNPQPVAPEKRAPIAPDNRIPSSPASSPAGRAGMAP